MKIFDIYFKMIFTVGILFLSGVDAGAANKRNINNEDSLAVKMNGVDDKMTIEDNVFYVDEWINYWFEKLDKNKDNQISKNELMDNFSLLDLKEYHLNMFNNEKYSDEGLSLQEFKSFADTTSIFTKEQQSAEVALAKPGNLEAESIDIVKLLAGVLAISLLMAAFRLM